MRTAGKVTLATMLALTLGLLAACSSSSNDGSSGTSQGTTAGTATAQNVSTYSASSDQLKKWQTDLNKVGCSAGPVDGIEGGETEAAIRAFQAASGLTVEGLLGPQTEAALTKAAAANKKVCGSGGGGGGSTSSSSSTSTPPTSSATTSTFAPNTPCPPNCAPNLAINPGSGKAGTTVYISSAGSRCAGPVYYWEPGATGPGSAGTLTAQGMNEYGLEFTVPAGARVGQWRFNAISCGANTFFEVTS